MVPKGPERRAETLNMLNERVTEEKIAVQIPHSKFQWGMVWKIAGLVIQFFKQTGLFIFSNIICVEVAPVHGDVHSVRQCLYKCHCAAHIE